MNRKTRAAALVAAALIVASPATAQESLISLTAANPRRWDVAADAGWLSSNKSDLGTHRADWYDVATGSGTLGYYWTPNLRSDVRIAFAGEGRRYQQQQISAPGQPFPVFRFSEHYFRTATIAGGVAYQFFDNQWFHPFVGGGLEVIRESHRVVSPEQRIPTRDPRDPFVVPSLAEQRSVSYAARPFVTTGFKWYVNERAFVRTDIKASFGRGGVSHTAWSAGIGVDL